MPGRMLFVFVIILLVLAAGPVPAAVDSQRARVFGGQDLHLAGKELIIYQTKSGEHILVFKDNFSMSIGANHFSSNSGVVWLESKAGQFGAKKHVIYDAKAYLQGEVRLEKDRAAKTTYISEKIIEGGESLIVRFAVTGEVFATAQRRETADVRGLELYKKAAAAMEPIRAEAKVEVQAPVPQITEEIKAAQAAEKEKEASPQKIVTEKEPDKLPLVGGLFEPKKEPVKAKQITKEERPGFQYPVNVARMGESRPKIESTKLADGTNAATVIGRFYLWQKLDEKGTLLELQADNAVIFYAAGRFQFGKGQTSEELLAEGAVQGIYLSGDVVMTEGKRTIRADEGFYDFQRRAALVLNAVMRTFDVSRGIPIYVRAAKLRQIAQNKFAAENIILSSSEFYTPQFSLNASEVVITDTTSIDEQNKRLCDRSYDALMRDITVKSGDATLFRWPVLRSNLQRPDVPIKRLRAGHDKTWGTSVESRWHLSRLLGLREPEGVENTLALDYFGKRGFGTGVEIEYAREKYFGKILGYLIHDSGKDRLGRISSRKDLEPPRELRGRFRTQHRHFLPYNWQLTIETSYLSDENFLEGFYRSEFNTDKEQETIFHVKRTEDNWALALLGKWRINDFLETIEELPSGEFHLTGQSLFDDALTFYSDSQVSRFRKRPASGSISAEPHNFFTFAFSRAELDMPMLLGDMKVVPFVAGAFGYEDQLGFRRALGGSVRSAEEQVWLGEAGLRVSGQYWKVYPDVKSRLWDINGIRHIVKPTVEAVLFAESDSTVKQRDTLNVGVLQRWQTRRGPADNQHTIDWMRLNAEFTWVKNSDDASPGLGRLIGPDRFIWNRPAIPLQKRLSSDVFGPRRNSLAVDYLWRLTDTAALLSDLNYDMQSGVVQQLNVGFSHLNWPNLSYYIGSRYLRRVEVLEEKGSNAVTFAATYMINPRYTITLSNVYDFDYGSVIQNDITLIRRYNRMYFSISYKADRSLDREAITFSIWPQGIPEFAIGSRRYMGLVGSE